VGRSIKGYSDSVTSVALSPDGKVLAFGNIDGTILLWDITAQNLIGQRLIGHSNLVKTIAFSADGTILASGGFEGDIMLWDVATRQPVGQPLIGHTGGVFSVAFHPNNGKLASGSVDNTVRVWDLDPQVWFKQTCRRVGRNLTEEEWAQYFVGQPYPRENLTCPQWQADQ
jgi:WD40 repeat protein